MVKRRFWFALLVAAIPGVAEAETITFDFAVGSERTYHLEISMHFEFTDLDGCLRQHVRFGADQVFGPDKTGRGSSHSKAKPAPTTG